GPAGGAGGTGTTATGNQGGAGNTTTAVNGSTSNVATSSSTGGGVQCMTPIKGPTRGSAIAMTSNDTHVITVNRDAGSVSVMALDTSSPPSIGAPIELAVGEEPWQVAINGCDDTAYVVLRKE